MKRTRRAQAVVGMALGLGDDEVAKWSKDFEDRVHDSVVEEVEKDEMRGFELPPYL
jgi:hypothetical protein